MLRANAIVAKAKDLAADMVLNALVASPENYDQSELTKLIVII